MRAVDQLKQLLEHDLPLAAQLSILEQSLNAGLDGEQMYQAVEYLYSLAADFPGPYPLCLDIVGTGGDGHHLFNISTASSFVAAGCGLPILKHGNTSVSSRSGSIDCLRALNIHLPATLPQALKQFEMYGISFLFAPMFYPVLAKVKEARQILAKSGQMTIFNILGPLLNPARPVYQLIGVAKAEFIFAMSEALYLLKRQAFVFSCEGTDEIIPGRAMNIMHVGLTGIKKFEFDYPKYGLQAISLAALAGGRPEDNALTLLQILQGEIIGPRFEVVMINTAFALMLYYGMNFAEAFAAACSSIKNGQAFQKLQGLQI